MEATASRERVTERAAKLLRRAVAPDIPGGLVLLKEPIEFGELGIDHARLHEFILNHFQRLEAVTGDADNDRLVARNAPLLNQLDGGGERGAAGGLGPDPFGVRRAI